MSIFDFFKKSKKADLIKENKYLDTVLANGKTIREQQEIACHQALGEFDEDIPTFNGMHIVSNTIPPKEDYEKLNNAEKIFFEEFSKQLINNKYKPEDVKLTRLSDGTLNVDYIPMCYIGKVNLYKAPNRYGVKKIGNKRPTRVFDYKEEAEEFAKKDDKYKVLILESKQSSYMQYLIGESEIVVVKEQPLDVLIKAISHWIKYLDYCIQKRSL